MEEVEKAFKNPEHPASFTAVDALYHAVNAKVSRKKIKEWLQSQEAYTLHRPARRRFPTNRVMVREMDQQFQADLVDMRSLSKENQGFKYILTCIDVLSKYAWAIPLKSKTGKAIIEGFEKIFQQRRSKVLQTDKGTEFKNQDFQSYLKKMKVRFFTTESEKKASIVERFNRTLKSKMWKYFTYYNTRRYVDVLDKLIHSYNHTRHSSIKMKPALVTRENQQEVWNTLYKDSGKKPTKFKFKVGESVRISRSKMVFEKGYEKNWTREIFFIHQRIARHPPVYQVADANGEVIKGTFYEQELQKVKKPDYYQVEKILKKRKVNGKTQYFVKFKDYPTQFNAWVSDLKKI
jgi:hypothetical protein